MELLTGDTDKDKGYCRDPLSLSQLTGKGEARIRRQQKTLGFSLYVPFTHYSLLLFSIVEEKFINDNCPQNDKYSFT